MKKKLTLHKETIRNLSGSALALARGGAWYTEVDTCNPGSESCPIDSYLECPYFTAVGACTLAIAGCVVYQD